MTFDEVIEDTVAWVRSAASIESDLAPPGASAGEAGEALAPRRADSPRARCDAEGVRLAATVRFRAWSDDALWNCRAVNAFFFTAWYGRRSRLSEIEPPDLRRGISPCRLIWRQESM